jgi:hypothetical protein
VLDANVLIKAGPRDTPLRAAEYDLYRPYWSETIPQEVERNLVSHRVTDNLRDFPAPPLEPYSVEAQSLDAFLTELIAQDPEQMTQILTEQGADLHPPRDRAAVIHTLAPHAPGFVIAIAEWILSR